MEVDKNLAKYKINRDNFSNNSGKLISFNKDLISILQDRGKPTKLQSELTTTKIKKPRGISLNNEQIKHIKLSLILINRFLVPKLATIITGSRDSTDASYLGRGLFLSKYYLNKKNPKILTSIILHEGAHILFARQVRIDNREYTGSLLKLFKEIKFQETAIYGKYDVHKSPLFKVFDESEYCRELPGVAGHPHDSADELQASATSVIFLFQKEFENKVNKLKPKQKKQALTIARHIARFYLSNDKCPRNLFSTEFLQFVGLQK